MRRLLLLFVASVAVYVAAVAMVLDRPLSLGLLRLAIDQKVARLATLPSPKLVILAGSNAAYSHSCAVMGPMLGMPCENMGVAVGIGLDDIFIRVLPLLRRGDVVYMPMEMQQYVTTAAENRAGADTGILIRHDRGVLATLGAARAAGAAFCCNLADVLEAVAEMPLAAAGVVSPAAMLKTQYDEEGDRIDNLARDADPALLRHPPRTAPGAGQIGDGFGTRLIARFVRDAAGRGVIVVGGLPTDFQGVDYPAATLAALSDVYNGNGGQFLVLPDESLYPPRDFFNSEDHLTAPCQAMHSALVATALAKTLGRPAGVMPPSAPPGCETGHARD